MLLILQLKLRSPKRERVRTLPLDGMYSMMILYTELISKEQRIFQETTPISQSKKEPHY